MNVHLKHTNARHLHAYSQIGNIKQYLNIKHDYTLISVDSRVQERNNDKRGI